MKTVLGLVSSHPEGIFSANVAVPSIGIRKKCRKALVQVPDWLTTIMFDKIEFFLMYYKN
jgi:hypothetical protein